MVWNERNIIHELSQQNKTKRSINFRFRNKKPRHDHALTCRLRDRYPNNKRSSFTRHDKVVNLRWRGSDPKFYSACFIRARCCSCCSLIMMCVVVFGFECWWIFWCSGFPWIAFHYLASDRLGCVLALSSFTKRHTNAWRSPTRHWQAQKSLSNKPTKHETNERNF